MSQPPDSPEGEIAEDQEPRDQLADIHLSDLTTVEAAEPPLSLEEDDPPRDQLSELDTRTIGMDQVRRQALWWVLALFSAILVVGAVAAMIGDNAWVNTKDFLGLTFASVVGLVGTVIGFYFGRGDSAHQS